MLTQAGKKVALVDFDLPGGTCTSYGCDAKILLDGSFEFAEELEYYNGLCVESVENVKFLTLTQRALQEVNLQTKPVTE